MPARSGGDLVPDGDQGFGKVTNELREFQANKRVMVVPLSAILDGGTGPAVEEMRVLS